MFLFYFLKLKYHAADDDLGTCKTSLVSQSSLSCASLPGLLTTSRAIIGLHKKAMSVCAACIWGIATR